MANFFVITIMALVLAFTACGRFEESKSEPQAAPAQDLSGFATIGLVNEMQAKLMQQAGLIQQLTMQMSAMTQRIEALEGAQHGSL